MTRDTAIYLHGFGPSLNVPVSQVLTFYTAVGIVLLSFALLVAFTGGSGPLAELHLPTLPLPGLGWLLASAPVRTLASVFGAVILAAVVACGWWGSTNALLNPAEYVVWIYFWVALLLLTAVVGDVWSLISPFPALGWLVQARSGSGPWRLPELLGAWPAVLLLLAWAWFELASGVSNQPRILALVVLGYALLNVGGMRAFGRDEWLRRCEAFTVLLSIVGRFGVVGRSRATEGRPSLGVRPWAVGLLTDVDGTWDQAAMVVVSIGTLAFDSFSGTAPWLRLEMTATPWLRDLGPVAREIVLRSGGLAATVLLFLVVFLLMIRFVLYLGSSAEGRGLAAAGFAYALVPIFIGYDAAHYLTYLFLQGPGLLPLLHDPLAHGRIAPYRPASIDPSTLWRLQIGLVVGGHVIAVALGHLRAREVFRTAERVLASQYPMLILMMLFTVASLWLLSGGASP